MPNRSTHQLPQTNTILAGDRAYLVRETSPGVWVDRSFDPFSMFMPLYSQTTNIDIPDIEALDSTPYEIVAAPASDKVILVRGCIIRFLGWTTPWTSGVDLRIGSTQLLNGSRFILKGPSETGGATIQMNWFYSTNLTCVRAGDSLSIETASALTGGDAAFSITTYYNLVDA